MKQPVLKDNIHNSGIVVIDTDVGNNNVPMRSAKTFRQEHVDAVPDLNMKTECVGDCKNNTIHYSEVEELTVFTNF